MSRAQLQLTAALADWMLPGTPEAPVPSVLGVHDFLDEWVSAPYPEQKADRAVIFEGLEWIEAEAHRRGKVNFLHLDATERESVLEALIPGDLKTPSTMPERFFKRFRHLVVSAYYTTPEGFQAIGYVGNVPLPSYPSVTEQERAILDAELGKLGIRA